MADENIQVEVEATSKGEGVYAAHADGIRSMRGEAQKTNEALQTSSLKTLEFLSSVQALRHGMTSLTRGIMFFAGENDALSRTLMTVNAGMALVTGAMQIQKGVSALLQTQLWGQVAAGVASNLWLAPVVVAVILGALATLWAAGVKIMGSGGSGVVTEPTLFVAGERGAESYSFVPMGSGAAGGGGFSIGVLNLTVRSDDPERFADELAIYLRRQRGAGR